MARFVSIGECMIELSAAGQPGLWQQGIAGDTLNTAWYARACLPADWQVDYFTRLGTDDFSAQIVDFLDQNGIGTDHIGRDPQRRPGLYAITLKEGERSFSYWRGESAARGLADDPQDLDRALHGASLAFVSGITVAILPPQGRQNLLDALGRARVAGTRVAFDPNIRPQLWHDPAEARDWLLRAARVADILLPSFDDEASCFGDTTAEATRGRYAALGVGEVVVKTGGGPVSWCCGAKAGTCHDLPRARPVDSTGAGDSFNGAYLAARLSGLSPEPSIALAHNVALQVIAHRGALMPQDAIDTDGMQGI